MKNKSFLIFSLLVLTFFSCKEREKSSDFTSTEKGFKFKHCVENKTSPKVKVGDIILITSTLTKVINVVYFLEKVLVGKKDVQK